MTGRSLLDASLLLLLALGTAAPGAAQVVEEPHWRRTVSEDAGQPLRWPTRPGVRGGLPGTSDLATRAGG
jgi:hypothetical protein